MTNNADQQTPKQEWIKPEVQDLSDGAGDIKTTVGTTADFDGMLSS